MLKQFSLFALLLCALALSSSHVAFARDSAAQTADRKAIMAIYAAMEKVSLARDTEKFMSYIAPDYMGYTLSRGTFNRDQLWRLTEILNNSDVKVTSTKTKITKFYWRGPDAVVWISSRIRAVGGRGVVVGNYTSRHYWGKPYRQWLLRQDVSVTRRAFQNGQLLPN